MCVLISKPLCLFQIVSSEGKFIATIRGVLHGGAIDNRKLTGLYPYSSGEMFEMLLHIEEDNTNSSISSTPFCICPCDNIHLECGKSYITSSIYPAW